MLIILKTKHHMLISDYDINYESHMIEWIAHKKQPGPVFCATRKVRHTSPRGEAIIIFESDGGITISVDGKELSYSDYDDLPSCI